MKALIGLSLIFNQESPGNIFMKSMRIVYLALWIPCMSGCVTEPKGSGDDESDPGVRNKNVNTAYFECLKDQTPFGPITEETFNFCNEYLPADRCKGETCKGLTATEILAVIRMHLREVRKCYEEELEINEHAKGQVDVTFAVQPHGDVQNIVVTKNDVGPRLDVCIKNKISKWLFPKPRGNQTVTVNYPFVFNPL